MVPWVTRLVSLILLPGPCTVRSIMRGTTGLGLTSPGNPDLKWETKSTLNLGY